MKTIPLEVKKSDTMQKIRTHFSDMQGISLVNLKSLFFAGNLLDIEEKKMGDYNITDGSIISVYLDSGSRIQIHVKISQLKKNITLDVDMRDTILSIKERIQNKEGVTVSNQDLVYFGEELDDRHTVASYNITAGSTIYALVREGNGMKIFVRNVKDESVIALKVKGWYTVENVKNMIESMVGIPIEKQRLYVDQVKLKNDRTLADLNISAAQTLNLIGVSGMVIHVKTPTGEIHTFVVDKSDTVDDVKKMIERKEGMSPHEQRLMVDGKRVADGWTLSDCNIQKYSSIHLIPVLRGC
ncbi:hypothetical protein ACHQM5_023688 [Ranunculus cassubicifolius]